MNILRLVPVALAWALASSIAVAGDGTAAKLEVRGAFSRATASNADPTVAGAFMTITNTGSEADKLIGATSNIAHAGGTHTHVRDGKMLNMVPVGAIDIPAGHTVTLQPGGMHVMFHGLKKPLEQGGAYSLTLQFAKSGQVTVPVEVFQATTMTYPGGPASMGPGMAGGSPMGSASSGSSMGAPMDRKP